MTKKQELPTPDKVDFIELIVSLSKPLEEIVQEKKGFENIATFQITFYEAPPNRQVQMVKDVIKQCNFLMDTIPTDFLKITVILKYYDEKSFASKYRLCTPLSAKDFIENYEE